MIYPYGIPYDGKSSRNFPVILMAIALLLSPLRLDCQDIDRPPHAKHTLKSASERDYSPFCIGGLAAALLLAMIWICSLRSNVARRVAKIKELESKYLQIFEANRDGFVIVDGQGRITDANKTYCDMLGYDLDELRNLPDFYSITPEKWHKWEREEIWQRRLLGLGWTGIYEKEYIRKNGTVFPVELQAGAVRDRNGTVSYFWGVARDISERKKAEQDIKGRLECEKIISETSSLSLTTSSLSDFMEDCVRILGEHLDISRAYIFQTRDGGLTFYNSHEWAAKDILPVKDSMQAVPAGDFKWFLEELSAKNAITIADVGKIPDTKGRLLLQSQYVKALTIAPFCSNGRIAGFVGLDECRAPREWLQSEEETLRSVCRIISNTVARLSAQEEEHMLSTAIENSSETVVVTDSQGCIRYVNPAFEKITGYSKAEALGQNPRILKSGKQDLDFYKDLWQQISSGGTWRGRFTNKRKNGTLYIEDAVISPVIGKDGTIRNFVAIKRDITNQLDIEKQFHAAQKMESIGRLAGGVAHDFNNMLAVILGFAELAMSKTNANDPVRKDIEQITKAGKHSAELTRQLLAFARRETAKPRILDICESIRDSAKMLNRMLGEDIEVILSLQREEIRVKMDPSQLDQILMNLCINARDAISGKGTISISTSKRSFCEEHCRQHPQFIPGNFAVISVADNGCGMDENVMNNIFEPFFTTKPSGKGTGLGLSTIYGIVKQNGGFITVSSTPGQGSIFDIHIPLANEKAEVPAEEKKLIQAAETIQWQNTTILVADDEPSVLTICRSMLENLGYNMIEADNPLKALDLAARKERIDLLLTDVVMPDMSGKELADKILQIHPECKVLYMSGYTADIISKKGIVGNNVGIVRKPFTKAELVEEVKHALAGAAAE